MKEEWRAVVGYEGLYEVSNLGCIRSLPRRIRCGRGYKVSNMQVLKPAVKDDGHLVVSLTKDGRGKEKRIHRLVLEAFVGPCSPGVQGCHFPDPNPANNRVDNLMWGTWADNVAHRKIHGMDTVGERSGNAKMTDLDVVWLKSYHATGDWSYRELANFFGVSRDTVKGIIKGKTWKHIQPMAPGTF